ncbi:MAG TPA: FecR domain-containing protein [Niastella sp.]|nr:FecR domain-containing protein [Niastella sp.]
MDVTSNTIEKLLGDESFLAWYFKTDPLATEKWNTLIRDDPEQRKLVDEAVQLLQTITIKEQPVDVQQIENAEARLMNTTLNVGGDQIVTPVVAIRARKFKWWAVAAIIFLTSIGVWQYYSHTSNKLVLQTAYGETRQDVLPDGSQVMLNANTTLDYRNWREGSDREVWVKGEAFFHVKKTAHKTKFIVHTGNFDVVVTGTQFNVISRNNKNNVLLKEGSVTVQHNGQELNMKPGDYIEFNNTGIQKKAINNAPVLAWTEHRFMFENTPMKEVASLVTELYGVKVNMADSCAAGTISGIMLNDNLDVFIQALDALSEYDVVKLDNEILIRKK